MESQTLIDEQFDRAVEIVQSLPKHSPIQTNYEQKLLMYSLYKQATVGNVQSPRPGIFDMLGRAKWDAWAKHKDVESSEAKWLYVEALLQVLRKYSDKTMARNLVRELESYGGDPANLVLSRSLSQSQDSESSGSTTSDPPAPTRQPTYPRRDTPESSRIVKEAAVETTDDEEDSDEEQSPLPPMQSEHQTRSTRPPSSMSSNRYRTPLPVSTVVSPPPRTYNIPATQPVSNFQTPSAFAEQSSLPAPPSIYSTGSYAGQYSQPELSPPFYRSPSQALPPRPASRQSLERAIEHIQAHLAALNERLDSFETRLNPAMPRSRGGSPLWSTQRSNAWDIDDLGMWSHLLNNPVSRGLSRLTVFLLGKETRSPTMIIVRRLCLDVSFLLCLLAVARALWKCSGVRRREVRAALIILGRAIVGKKEKTLDTT